VVWGPQVIPNGQSLIADLYGELDRGKAFGALYLTGAVGAMLGTLYATNMGHLTIWGMEGWRFVFVTVAALSITIGVLTALLAREPRLGSMSQLRVPGAKGEARASMWSTLCQAAVFMRLPTFMIVILQGIVGSSPWNAMVFFTLYFQLLGMSDFSAALLYALFLAGTAAGGLIGGWVGDVAARRYPNHGRIFVTQFSIIACVPFSLLVLKGLPWDGEPRTVAMYAVSLTAFGAMASWAAPAFNNPCFAEIVPEEMRTMIYAFDRSLEMALAALAAPLVGILAERVFGYEGTASASKRPGENLHNAEALGNALLVCMIVPWTLCCIFYSGLHFTYPKDRDSARVMAQSQPLLPDADEASV